MSTTWGEFPPRSEQNSIAAFLTAQLDAFADTRRAVERQLDRLQEYRQALINAAVTGRLDIPTEVPI